MSLVVAVKDKNRIVLGADKQTSAAGNKEHNATKIWEVEELPGALMGSIGSVRASQIIQFANIIDKNAIGEELDTSFIICSLVPVISAGLKANGISVKAPVEDASCDMMSNAFIFAYKDKAWMIWHDFSVSEIEDYLVVGSGSDVARGALFATKENQNPFDRIVTAIDAAAETTLYVDNGIDLLATKYYEEDKQAIADALGLKLAKPKPKKSTKKSATKSKKVVKEQK